MMYNPFYSSSLYKKYPKYNYYAGSPYYYKNGYHANTPSPPKQVCEEISSSKQNTKEKEEKKEDREFFEILGIKLYFDDILLICLIFFLYNEGVKDESLFIALILLLLS